MIQNKKAQGMSTNTIILLILGVVVLVVLVLGFTIGWEKISPFVESSNVDEISKACSASCGVQSKYDYCSAPRVLKDLEGNEVKTSCYVLSGISQFSQYGIESCPQIDCDLSCDQINIDGVVGNSSVSQGTYDVSSLVSDQTCFVGS